MLPAPEDPPQDQLRAADERGHQMLPLDAALSTEPGATSTVKVGDPESVFEMPQS